MIEEKEIQALEGEEEARLMAAAVTHLPDIDRAAREMHQGHTVDLIGLGEEKALE